jgi:hypothetical protein
VGDGRPDLVLREAAHAAADQQRPGRLNGELSAVIVEDRYCGGYGRVTSIAEEPREGSRAVGVRTIFAVELREQE